MKITISKTGRINGRGSMPYKWVSGLSQNEMLITKRAGSGEHVVILDANAIHHTQCGLKRVIYKNGRYTHREATPEILAEYNRIKIN